jgi:hypothetical protein
MALADEFRGLLQERMYQNPQTATIQGKTISCSISIIDKGRDVIQGGKWIIYRGTLTYLRDAVLALPIAGQTIVFNGQTLYIENVHSNPNFPMVKLEISNTPPPH